MREVTLEELKQLAEYAREEIWAFAKGEGREPKLYAHWSAGHYGQPSEHYHINIDKDGTILVSTDNLADVKPHTWHRNSGAVGIALLGCFDATSNNLGTEPPTAAQIESMAQVITVVADALWLTIDKQHVLTHGEAANNEDGDSRWHNPYPWWNDSYHDGDTRGDLEYLGTDESPAYNPWSTDGTRGGDVLRGKANWYRNQNK